MGEAKKRGTFEERRSSAMNRRAEDLLLQRHVTLIDALNSENVRYLVIGGKALQAHGIFRETKDLDIWAEPTRENAAAVTKALVSISGERAMQMEEGLGRAGVRVALPTPEHPEIDLLTSVGNLDFDEIYRRSVSKASGVMKFKVPTIEDLIATKEVGRDETKRQIDDGTLTGLALSQARSVLHRDEKDIESLQELL